MQFGKPLVRVANGPKGKTQRIGGQMAAQAVGPFDQANRCGKGVVQPKLKCLIRMTKTVQVGVPDVGVGFIGLDQREGWRRHIFRTAQPGANEGAAEMGFACANRPVQQNRITRAQQPCQRFRQTAGVVFGVEHKG